MTKSKMVLNPGNGIVETICEKFKKPFSFVRIRFNVSLVVFTILSGFIIKGKMVGVSANILDKKIDGQIEN